MDPLPGFPNVRSYVTVARASSARPRKQNAVGCMAYKTTFLTVLEAASLSQGVSVVGVWWGRSSWLCPQTASHGAYKRDRGMESSCLPRKDTSPVTVAPLP